MDSIPLPLAIALTLATLAAPTTSAEPVPVTDVLATVDVEATAVERREQRLRKSRHSASIVELDRKRADQSNIVGSEDYLRYAPNLTVRSRYIGDRNALIGGRSNTTTSGSRSLVYVDGLLISDLLGASFNPPRWGMVSPGEIQNFAILYGPFAAELPGNSMGTTVEITTRYPRDLTATADVQAFGQYFRDDYGHADTYQGQRAAASAGAGDGRFRWFVAANALDTHAHPMQYATPSLLTTDPSALPAVYGARLDQDPQGRNRIVLGPTGIEHTRQSTAKVKFAADLTDDATLEFVLGGWHNDYRRDAASFLRNAQGHVVYRGDWRLPDGRGIRIGDSTFSPQHGTEQHYQYAGSLTWQLTPAWSTQVLASRYRVAENRLRSALRPPDAVDPIPGTIADGDGTGWSTLDIKLAGDVASHHLRTGFHLDHYALDQRVFGIADWREGTPAHLPTDRFAGKARTYAGYVQDEWPFAPDWTALAGIRFEHWQAYQGVRGKTNQLAWYPQRRESALSPKAALSWQATDYWRWRASVGKAVRFPTVSELFQGSLSANAIVNADPNLRPERSYSKELAAEGVFRQGDVRITLFEDDIRDTLQSQTNLTVTPTVTNIQNVERTRNRGIEIAGQWSPAPELEFQASAAVNDAKVLRNTKYTPAEGKRPLRIPRTRANLLATWHARDDLSLTLAARHSGRQWNTLDNVDYNGNTFGAASAFTVFDAKATWKVREGWKLGFGIDNLADKRYWVFHPYPARTVVAELRYEGGTQ
ncbi:TonB-dependent receptor [Tahibacter amnicola]|uniref:TonB-dependent receptor n=1 Tax=Tahibacter amnicola TaxID=2976241 RepID=A0ABY6BAK2_9GAMM|nr:TonB-dependent receptor [Tahibacter amnicola]UXI66885.1 TonB-dependent receptor [Tahibacter amnicola]